MINFNSYAYNEVIKIGDHVSSLAGSIEYTLFRVGRLTNDPSGPVNVSYLGSGQDKLSISRASVVTWVLEEIKEDRWVGKAPYICNG